MRTEPWWTCSCGAKIYRVGKGKARKWEEHLRVCPITEKRKQAPAGTYIPQGMHIVQHPQAKK